MTGVWGNVKKRLPGIESMKFAKRYSLAAVTCVIGVLFAGASFAESQMSNSESSAAINKSSTPLSKGLMHIDPLDEGRAGAIHRGKNPHAKLTAKQHIEVALKHFSEGRLPQAMAALDQAIVKYPDEAALYNIRASLNMSSEDTSRALADIEQAIKLDSGNALSYVVRAQVYLKFERKKEAMADLNKAVQLAPEWVPAYFNRGTLLSYQGKNQQALKDFDACIALEPHLPAPYFNRGSLYYLLGEKKKARADIKRFMQIASVDSWKKSAQDLLKVWDEAEKKEGG
jgi:tetratricopeptide (TPR) repeat protein